MESKNPNIHTIHSFKEARFYELIEKINKKARKLGLPEVQVKELGRKHVAEVHVLDVLPDAELAHPAYDLIEVELIGDTPFIAGWNLLGTLEHDSGTGINIVRAVPGQAVPQHYWNSDGLCDHCGAKRNRKDTFILQEVATGKVQQIGRNCVADFLPGLDPKVVAEICKFYSSTVGGISSDDDGWADYNGPWCREQILHDVGNILSLASAIIRKDGWKSRTNNYDGVTTAGSISRFLYPPSTRSESDFQEWKKWAAERKPTDGDKALSAKVVEWLQNKEATTEYFHNLRAYAVSGKVNDRGIGFVASAIVSYHKEVERLEQLSREKQDKLNEWVGKEGERLRDLELEVKRVRYSEGNYGTTSIISFEDAQGRQFTWFASGDIEAFKGDKFKLTGTVKKHGEYQGIKQTVLTRCKYVREEVQDPSDGAEVRAEEVQGV